jgi:hypothetical protein
MQIATINPGRLENQQMLTSFDRNGLVGILCACHSSVAAGNNVSLQVDDKEVIFIPFAIWVRRRRV